MFKYDRDWTQIRGHCSHDDLYPKTLKDIVVWQSIQPLYFSKEMLEDIKNWTWSKNDGTVLGTP